MHQLYLRAHSPTQLGRRGLVQVEMAAQCPFCMLRGIHSLSEFLRHVRLSHADGPNFVLQCNLQGCSRTFKRFESYRNHVYTYHDFSAVSSVERQNLTEDESRDDGNSNSNSNSAVENQY